MSRKATGTVQFRGNPPRWFARVTGRDKHGNVVRPWVDLERPDLKNTPEDKATAEQLAKALAGRAMSMIYDPVRVKEPRKKPVEIKREILRLLSNVPDRRAIDIVTDVLSEISGRYLNRARKKESAGRIVHAVKDLF